LKATLDERRIFAEQLRLVLDGISQSLPVGTLLAALLVWTLSETTPIEPLAGWFILFFLGRLLVVRYCKRKFVRGFELDEMPTIVRWLLVNKCIEGALWGALVWMCMETATTGGSILLLALLAAIAGNAVSLLAPVLVLYVGLVLPMLALGASKLWLMGTTANMAMAICCILYVAGQFGQARNNGRSIRESVALRFENVDLIERLKVESTLAQTARQEAENANQAKSRFLAAASHDLRQPIHALGLFLEVLSRSGLTPSQRRTLEHANAATLASSEMLNTLLDFSRIEAGVIHSRPQLCRLQPLLNKLENELAYQADAKGLVYRSKETSLAVVSDPALLELMLRNLISNAIRYTELGGVLIACRLRETQVAIEIFDTGIGIAADQQQAIFREFYQLGNPERDRRKGLGLGLAITDGLARSLGHRLSLRSVPGRGSVFRIYAPHAVESGHDTAWNEAQQPLEDRSTGFAGQTVLVIDDDETVRVGMCHLLSDWGYTCIAVESMEEALEVHLCCPPDAIISDYRLRERQRGADVIRSLRAHFGRTIPALLITGDTAPERLREAGSSGIPLLHKPVSPNELHQALGALLAMDDGR
jgi:signal transduction histidine kinase